MQITIRAKQSKKIFLSENYQVIVYKTINGSEKSSFTACGNLPRLSNKEEIILTGEFKNSKRYGEQFLVYSWKRSIPETTQQLIGFFSSSLFKGIGKKMAGKIVNSLGNEAIQRISKEGPACLILNVEGMKKDMAEKISKTVQETFLLNDLIEKYAAFGISTEILLKAQSLMGQKVTELNGNPFLLAEHHLIHFSSADEIGKSMGILPHAFERLETFIKLALKEFIIKQGHCYLEESEFIKKSLLLLNRTAKSEHDKVLVPSFINAMEQSKTAYISRGRVYPRHLYFAEKDVAESIHRLSMSSGDYNLAKTENAILAFEKDKKVSLTKQQKDTIHQLMSENVLILTGGPGTGKTFTVNGVLNVYKKLFPNDQVALTAPTGRAAKKLGEVTGMGSHALTIHRLLGMGILGNDKPLFDESIQLPQKLVIADEFSMADVQLSANLFKAIEKGSKLLIVGDPDQLPSPGAGNVLKDLLDAGIPHVRLKKIFRQAEESTIVKNAHKINRGEPIEFTNTEDQFFIDSPSPQRTAQLVVHSVERFLKKGNTLDDIMVLSPMKKGEAGVDVLNESIRNRVNPSSGHLKEVTHLSQTYRTGDKVMYIKNNKVLGVFNGDVGTIKNIGKKIMVVEIDGVTVEFEKEEWKFLKLAYATSIHKAQGGQAKVVITVLSDEHDIMLTRNLFYTALTRTESIFVLIGSKNAAIKAIKTNRVRERNSSLNEILGDLRKYINNRRKVQLMGT